MATVFVKQMGCCVLYQFEAFWGGARLCSWRDDTISSLGSFGSMDWRRQEPGCPNECLKVQADVVHTCTSLGIIKEEDLMKFPPLCLQCQLMLSDSQMLFTSVLIDFWLCVGSEHCWCMM